MYLYTKHTRIYTYIRIHADTDMAGTAFILAPRPLEAVVRAARPWQASRGRLTRWGRLRAQRRPLWGAATRAGKEVPCATLRAQAGSPLSERLRPPGASPGASPRDSRSQPVTRTEEPRPPTGADAYVQTEPLMTEKASRAASCGELHIPEGPRAKLGVVGASMSR